MIMSTVATMMTNCVFVTAAGHDRAAVTAFATRRSVRNPISQSAMLNVPIPTTVTAHQYAMAYVGVSYPANGDSM